MKTSTIARALIPFITVLLISCTSSVSKKWKEIKKTGSAYPEDTIMVSRSIVLQLQQVSWINTAYQHYPYKQFCGTRIVATFDLTQPSVITAIGRDSLALVHSLVEDFRKDGIAHFVAQTINGKKLGIYLYTEDDINPIGKLTDFRIPNEGIIENDKEWTLYSELLSSIK